MATERSSLTAEGLGLSLPYSIEAEQAVLGAAILNHDLVPQMVSRLRQEFFYSRQNGKEMSDEQHEFVERLVDSIWNKEGEG